MMKKMDMHMHSIYSDGELTPVELVNMAKKNNVFTLALTDHDNIAGSKEIVKLNTEEINIYSGVELSAKVDRGRMHILGYNIDLEDKTLNEKLSKMKENSIYNFLLYVELLKKEKGIVLPQEEVDVLLKYSSDVGRVHIALLLVKLGICSTVSEAFDLYLVDVYKKASKLRRGISKEECIELIEKARGVAVLAHPVSLLLDDDSLDLEVGYLKSCGLKGIEVIHIHNVKRDLYNRLALKYDLLVSGGTDFHGETVKPNVLLGSGVNGNVNILEGDLTLIKNISNRYRSVI